MSLASNRPNAACPLLDQKTLSDGETEAQISESIPYLLPIVESLARSTAKDLPISVSWKVYGSSVALMYVCKALIRSDSYIDGLFAPVEDLGTQPACLRLLQLART